MTRRKGYICKGCLRYIQKHNRYNLFLITFRIFYRRWPFLLIGSLFVGGGALYYHFAKNYKLLLLPSYLWLYWIGSLLWIVPIVDLISFLISFVVKMCLSNNWKFHFYYPPLESSMYRFLLINLIYISFIALVHTLTTLDIWKLNEKYGKLTTFFHVFLSILVLTWFMMIKTIAIRFFDARIYLSNYFRLFEKLKAFESWLSLLSGEKDIFTPNFTNFLVKFPSHPNSNTLYRRQHLYALCININNNSDPLIRQFKNLIILPPSLDIEHGSISRNSEKSNKVEKEESKLTTLGLTRDSSAFADVFRENDPDIVQRDQKDRKTSTTSSLDHNLSKDFYHFVNYRHHRNYLHPPWARMTWNTLTIVSQCFSKENPQNYLKTWFDYCEVVDPLWKNLRIHGRASYNPTNMRDHITLWAFDSKKSKVTVIDDKSLKKIAKILAAYVMRYVLSTAMATDEPLFAKELNQNPSIKVQNSTPQTQQSTNEENSSMATEINPSKRTIRGYLLEKDFIRLFGNNKRNEAHRAFRAFATGQTGKLTYTHLHRRIHHFLANTINARQTYDSYQDILANLEASVSILVFLVACFVFLLIFHYDIITAISMYASIMAVVVLFTYDALSSAIHGVLLVCLFQPFSVGDVIILHGTRYTVRKIGLTSSVLETKWGTSAVWANTLIFQNMQQLFNLTKSRSEWHDISIYLDQEVTNYQIEKFTQLFTDYMKQAIPSISSENIAVVNYAMDSMGRTQICIWVDSGLSFSNDRARWNQHSAIIFTIRKVVEELKLTIYWPPHYESKDRNIRI